MTVVKRESLRVSPQQIDPLSWFTRPLVAIVFAAVIAVYGVGTVLIEWTQIAHPVWDLVAVALMASAAVFVQVRTRPFQGRFSRRHTAVAVIGGLLALGLSTWANLDSTVLIQYWWAPVGVAFITATLAPLSSVVRLLVVGAVVIAATTIASLVAFLSPPSGWPPVSTAVIGASTVVVGVFASAVFSYVVVSRTQSLLAGAGVEAEQSELAHFEAISRVERRTVARLAARVAPFLETLADVGTVTDEDRALAGQLARRLRADLVERANRSWLDGVAEQGRIFIVDPERRAERMNGAQRSALRGLILAALRTPGTDAGSLFIELRPHADGSTAVALSIDIDLPEGRRAMLLAPYYLALEMTVSEMTYDPARELLRFRVDDLD